MNFLLVKNKSLGVFDKKIFWQLHFFQLLSLLKARFLTRLQSYNALGRIADFVRTGVAKNVTSDPLDFTVWLHFRPICAKEFVVVWWKSLEKCDI